MDKLVRETMENVMDGVCELLVPLKVSLGWGDCWAGCKWARVCRAPETRSHPQRGSSLRFQGSVALPILIGF